ncbi:Rrf2 family transcriptional regulator [Lampropedia puyangensis]|uniref:Rrf2 family transcriptional regulator n=1 Tax=Lampropedia puyangensis TaxID=1330072 RepID=A0A4S8EX60_9BURK|nr:Rrf2 family transcriptional regulator [Lampropedia puyangensis]THT98444.1 Rrf2 family transcriptional regulator [Lampropedia puyangensis]
MRLTLKTDYALRTLLYLAKQPEKLASIGEIAKHYDISENHLIKVVHELGRKGFIETIRGKGGGIRFAATTKEVRLGDIVRAFEDDFALVDCFKDPAPERPCRLTGNCGLQGILSNALQAFFLHLDQYKFKDLLDQGSNGAIGLPIKIV